MPTFSQLKKQLNPEQLKAVETIEGPVMVLAGPGSGKTQVVAMRIGEILQKTQANPSNILALTFTEAGATEMRQRLVELIGPEGYRVAVQTFHGFAGEVIGSFPHVFAQTRELTQLTEISRFTLIQELLDAHPQWQLLRPLRAPGRFIKDISSRLKTCKQEAVTSEKLRDFAKSELKASAEEKSKVKREQRQNQAKRLAEFADFFDAYQAKLTQNGSFDFEDTILFVINALETNAEIRAFFQEKYQYLLVDEYQDTNNAQNKLVELLADFFPNPNLFVVGDDKQAIYRFQGASVANLLHFAKKYPSLEIIELKKNYRSTPEILNAATALINHNQIQIGQFLKDFQPELIAVNKPGPKPQLVALGSPTLQWQFIVDTLKTAHKTGAAWPELAVLFRTNAAVEAFRRFAEGCGLPLANFTAKNIVTEPIVQTLLQALRAVVSPTNNQATYSLARLLLGRDQLITLLTVQQQAGRDRQPLIAALAADPATKKVAHQITDYHQKYQLGGLVDLLLDLIKESRLTEQLAPVDQLNNLELLRSFVALADSFAKSNLTSSPADFIRSVETMIEQGLGAEAETLASLTAGVHLSTLHKAKGREFELVVLADADERSYQPRPDRNPIILPSVTDLKKLPTDDEDDQRRLFYVGMTRAKKRLYLTYAKTNSNGQANLPCLFVRECGEFIESQEIVPTEAQLKTVLENSLKQPAATPLAAAEISYVRQRVRELAFSASSLHAYQVCPRQFLLSAVLRLPTPSSIAQEYGTAVHAALEEFGRLQKGIKKLPTKSQLEGFFAGAVRRLVQTGNPEPALAKGQAVLSAFYDQVLRSAPPPEAVEYSFSGHHVMLGDIPLTGKLDRIELIDPELKTVRLVDYKTGVAKTRNEIEGHTQSSDGEIKQQLVFYALLAEFDPRFRFTVKEYVVQFVDDAQTFRREVFTVSREEIAALKKTIQQVRAEILELNEFTHTRLLTDRGCQICATFPSL